MSEDDIVALKAQVEALKGWKAQALAVHEAADNKLRPLLASVPGALGRNVYDVAADEIQRLRAVIVEHQKGCRFDQGWEKARRAVDDAERERNKARSDVDRLTLTLESIAAEPWRSGGQDAATIARDALAAGGLTVDSLDEHNRKAAEAKRDAHLAGVSCPKCWAMMYLTNPGRALTCQPSKVEVHCPVETCGYRGHMTC